TDVADDIAALDRLARPYRKPRQVAVTRADAEAVRNHDGISVVPVEGGQLARAVCRRVHRHARVGRNVETGMELVDARERILARAERRRVRPAADERPNRRRRATQRLYRSDEHTS